MGMGDVAGARCPRSCCSPRRATAAPVCTRTFMPGALPHLDRRARRRSRVAAGMLLPRRGRAMSWRRLPADGAPVRRRAPDRPPATSTSRVEQSSAEPAAAVVRSAALRTARKMFDGTRLPRARACEQTPARGQHDRLTSFDIAHLGNVELLTHNLEESLWFFRDLLACGGAENGTAGDSVFLRTWDDYENYTIKLTARADAGVGRTDVPGQHARGAANAGWPRSRRPDWAVGWGDGEAGTARRTRSPTRTGTTWASTTRPSGTAPRTTSRR